MHTFIPITLLTLACAATGARAREDSPTSLPQWLAGHWCGGTATRTFEEHWLPPAGGLMLGVARSVSSGKKAQFEFLRIELVEGIPAYIAQPQGLAPTTFTQVEAGADWARFENPAHDFPQRVEYRRQGDDLSATIAGPSGDGKQMTIPYAFKRCAG